MDQFQEIVNAQRGPPVGHDIERIFCYEVGPVRRQGAQLAGPVMEPGPVLTPVLATLDQFELSTEERMVRVRHPKRSALTVTMRRS